jgi:hypothetical protein
MSPVWNHTGMRVAPSISILQELPYSWSILTLFVTITK